MRPGRLRWEGTKLFGDNERGVVGEHNPSAAYADGFGCAGDMANEHGGGGTGQSCDGMVFGEPVAGISPTFHVLRQIDGARDGASGGFARAHACKQ